MRLIDADALLEAIEKALPISTKTALAGNIYALKRVLDLIKDAPTVPAIDWIPFRSREMTEEERKEYPANIAAMWDEPTPDDEQIILITDGTIAWTDKFLIDPDDGGCYLGSGVDIEEGMAWAPCPKLYKKENGNEH